MLIDPFNGLTFRYSKRPWVWFTKEIPKQIELFRRMLETSTEGDSIVDFSWTRWGFPSQPFPDPSTQKSTNWEIKWSHDTQLSWYFGHWLAWPRRHVTWGESSSVGTFCLFTKSHSVDKSHLDMKLFSKTRSNLYHDSNNDLAVQFRQVSQLMTIIAEY